LLIGGGRLRVPENDSLGNPNQLRRLRLRHCTLAPGSIAELSVPDLSPPVAIAAQGPEPRLVVELPSLIVEIDNCIVGPIRAVPGAEVHISNSIVDASSSSEIAFADPADDAGAPLKIENSTIIGKVFTETMKLVSNTIFFSRSDSRRHLGRRRARGTFARGLRAIFFRAAGLSVAAVASLSTGKRCRRGACAPGVYFFALWRRRLLPVESGLRRRDHAWRRRPG